LEASNGTEALILFGQKPDVALLLTDMVMPSRLAGDKLAEEIRRLKPDIRVVFTSGYASPQVADDRFSENEIWLENHTLPGSLPSGCANCWTDTQGNTHIEPELSFDLFPCDQSGIDLHQCGFV
jgi:CheY-like chemotaxis protein